MFTKTSATRRGKSIECIYKVKPNLRLFWWSNHEIITCRVSLAQNELFFPPKTEDKLRHEIILQWIVHCITMFSVQECFECSFKRVQGFQAVATVEAQFDDNKFFAWAKQVWLENRQLMTSKLVPKSYTQMGIFWSRCSPSDGHTNGFLSVWIVYD